MTKKLNQLTLAAKKIVGGYRPEGIILLETRGVGNQDSAHLDLVVLKETPKSPFQRRGDVESLLTGSEALVDVAVYTPDELRYLYSIGDPFVHRIMREGRLVYMRKATMLWVAEAREELESALVLYDHELFRSACYHSRQAVEKGLHAMIMSKVRDPDISDDIVELYNRANTLGFKTGLAVEDVVYVNSFGVHKCPVEEALLPRLRPSREEAERAVDCARRLVEKLASVKAPKSSNTEAQR